MSRAHQDGEPEITVYTRRRTTPQGSDGGALGTSPCGMVFGILFNVSSPVCTGALSPHRQPVLSDRALAPAGNVVRLAHTVTEPPGPRSPPWC